MLKEVEWLPPAGKKYVFVGHDFNLEGGRKKSFRKAISHCLKDTNYTPLYSDLEEGFIVNTFIIKDIKEKIKRANFCIFDLTGFKKRKFKNKKKKLGKNLNVILEVGISIGLEKEAFITYREGCVKISDELRDLAGNIVPSYKKTFRELKNKVKNFIESLEHIESLN